MYDMQDDTTGGHVLLKLTYAGDFQNAATNAAAYFTTVNMTPGATHLNQLVHAFDSSFDVTKFGCGIDVHGQYALLRCSRGIQNSYGWLAIMAMGDKLPLGSCTSCMHVIGAINLAANAQTRWAGTHAAYLWPEAVPLVSFTPHSMDSSGGCGTGPYYTTLTSGIGTGDTTIHVAGEPQEDDGTEPWFQNAAIGDIFSIGSELLGITGKSGTNWTVARALNGTTAQPASIGAHAQMVAGSVAGGPVTAQDFYWHFLDDPNGSTTTGFQKETHMWGGHEDFWSGGRAMEPYWGVIGPAVSRLNTAPDWNMTVDVAFAGAQSRGDGNAVTRYPSFQQYNATSAEKTWFTDEPTFYGTSFLGTGATSISGQLYKYVFGDWGGLHRKQLETLATAGDQMLTDISSPATGSVLGTTSGDSYKYCVAYAVNECRNGSSIGDVYVNTPSLDSLQCLGEGGQRGLCVSNMPEANGAFQFGWTANTVGLAVGDPATLGLGYSRKVSGLFAGPRGWGKLFKVLPDASWGFINPGLGTLMVKIPPTPALDGVDRSTFVGAPISITPPGGSGIATATVEFGYVEQGTPTQYYCTSRREACVAVASTVTDATPFQYKTTDSYTKAPCATSCTITLPVLPVHVAYFQVKFYDGSGSFVQNGSAGIALESAVHTLTVNALSATTAAAASATFSAINQAVTLSATVTSAGGTVNAGTVTFTVKNGPSTIGAPVTSATVSGGAASANFTLPGGTAAGPYTIQAVYTPGADFSTSNDSTHTLTVGKATPIITWANPAAIVFGSALSNVQLNATANTGGTFVYTPALGTVLPVGNGQALSVQFTPSDTTDFNGAPAGALINVLPAAGPATLVMTQTLARDSGTNEVVVTLTLANTGGTAATAVQVTSAKIGTTSTTTALPDPMPDVPAGGSSSMVLWFPGLVGAAGTRSVLSVSGVYSAGSFGGSSRVTLP
jgi:hypothetical protein